MSKYFVILILLFSVLSLNAEDKKVIDMTGDSKKLSIKMDDAVDLALKNNLGIESENLTNEYKKWSTFTSWNAFLPTMSFNIAISRTNLEEEDRTMPSLEKTSTPPGFTMGEKISPLWTPGFSFDLTWRLNAAMGFAVYAAVLDYKGGKISFETAKKKLMKEVKKTFNTLLLTRRSLEVFQDNVNMAEKRYNQTQINYKNGLVPEYNVLSAQVALENLKPQLMEMKNNYNIYLVQFKQMIGIKNEVEITLDGELKVEKTEDFNAKELISKKIDERLDMQSTYLKLKNLENMKNISISYLTPSFLLKFSADPSFQYDISKSDTWKEADNAWKQRSGMLMFALSLPVDSWLPFSKTQMDILKYNYDMKKLNVSIKQMKQMAEVEIESIILKLKKSISSLESLKLNVKLAEKAFKMADDAYKVGSKELLDVEDAQSKLNSAKFNLMKEEYNYITGLLDLEYSLEVGTSSGGASTGGGSATQGADSSGAGAEAY